MIVREYDDTEFNEATWRLKWEMFVHPHTGENGEQYLTRMKNELPFNPKLQRGSKKIILIEPMFGPSR